MEIWVHHGCLNLSGWLMDGSWWLIIVNGWLPDARSWWWDKTHTGRGTAQLRIQRPAKKMLPDRRGKAKWKGLPPKKKNSRFLLETLWWILGWQSHVCFWNHLVSGFLSKISKKKQDVPASRRSYHPSDVSEFLHGCQMMFDISFNSYEQTYWQIMINGEMETRPAVLVRLEFTIYLSLQYPGAHLEDDVVSFFGSQFPCDICV